MPNYQMYFHTQAGWKNFNADVDEHETPDKVLTDILRELEEKGYILEGSRDGKGDFGVIWEGRALDLALPLPGQGVRPNDILRVSIKADESALQLRRGDRVLDVVQREELLEGDDVIVGRSILRFHIRRQEKIVNQQTTFIQRMQQGRSIQQIVYFMSLVGGIAGLCCWFLASSLTPLLRADAWAVDFVNLTILGALIGVLTVGFNDRWLGDRILVRWLFAGLCIGAVAGAAGGLFQSVVRMTVAEAFPLLARAVSWMFAGAFIGFGISLRWVKVNKARVLHGFVGGMAGGLLGGLLFWTLRGMVADVSQALGFMVTAMGISCGASLAPILLRQGVLEFASSGDPTVLEKYGHSRRQWEIHDGGKYLIGSLSAASTQTWFAPEVQIHLPDQTVAPRHAILTSKARHYIEPHSELMKSVKPVYSHTRKSA